MRKCDMERSPRDQRVGNLILQIEASEQSEIAKIRMLMRSVRVDVIDYLGTNDEDKLNEALSKLTYLLEEKLSHRDNG